MQYSRVHLESIGYELGPVVVTSQELEDRLKPLYEMHRLQPGQLETLTGIIERRWWEPDTSLSNSAIAAARKALAKTAVNPQDIQSLIYGGVCRENFEPATACRIANALGIHAQASVYDISNACLGVLNGMIEIANRIELGQIRAGMVVSCESAREINEVMIEKMIANSTMEYFVTSLATLTGGSGAVAIILTDGSFPQVSPRHRFLGGMFRTAPEYHGLCRWGLEQHNGSFQVSPIMYTDSVAVLKYGVEVFQQTWNDFLHEMEWTNDDIDIMICHQVGAEHRKQFLRITNLPMEKDLISYEYLGNIGTVSLPITAAIHDERQAIEPGDHVGFMGIGSGLNCILLGFQW
jgi:3-oxoacyl-[acyl-carrier-protein] synthase-3